MFGTVRIGREISQCVSACVRTCVRMCVCVECICGICVCACARMCTVCVVWTGVAPVGGDGGVAVGRN